MCFCMRVYEELITVERELGREIRERRRTQREDKKTGREEVKTYRIVMVGGKFNIVNTETKRQQRRQETDRQTKTE